MGVLVSARVRVGGVIWIDHYLLHLQDLARLVDLERLECQG